MDFDAKGQLILCSGFVKYLRKNVSVSLTYSRVCLCKRLSDEFIIRNGLKQGDAL